MRKWQRLSLLRRRVRIGKYRVALAGAVLLIMSITFARSAHALDPARFLTQYGHQAWLLQDGELRAPVYPMAQTPDGYLWIGTQAGVVRFDGVRFVPLDKLAGKSLDGFIGALWGASDGSLWIGTRKELARWQGNQLTVFTGYHPLNLVEDEGGTIWFFSASENKQVCAVEGTRVHCHGKDDGLDMPAECCGRMSTDGKGTFWIGTQKHVVRWRNGTRSETYAVDAVIKGGVIGDMITSPDPGAVWVGVIAPGPGLGLQRLANGKLEPFARPGFDGSSLAVQAMFRDREGTFWVGTVQSGIYRILPDRVDHFESKDGLSSDCIYSMFEDAAGSMWITTSKGLDRLRELRVSSFTTREGLAVDEVDSVLASRNGTIWMGTALSLEILEHGRVRSVGAAQGLPGSQVTAMFEDNQGRLWLGVDNKLSIYVEGKFKLIPGMDGNQFGWVVALTQDKQGDMWAAIRSDPRKTVRLRDDRVVEELVAPSFPVAQSLSPDPTDGIWIGRRDGDFARLRSGSLESFATGVGSSIKQIVATPGGEVFGASAKGLVLLKDGAVRVLGANNGLPCDAIYGFVEDDRKALWLQMDCGIVRVERAEVEQSSKDPGHTMHSEVLDVLDGVHAGFSPFGRPVRTPDGRLWFGNGVNLQMLDPSGTDGGGTALPIYVEQVVADHTFYPLSERLTLPALTRDVQIDYTALDLAVPQRLRFRYRLEGRDLDWTEAQQRRQAFFTNLPPGDYRFRVATSRGNGGWHEASNLQFAILPAFYQTAWFLALVTGAVVAALWRIYSWRLAQVKVQIQTRWEERITERERIARELHDTFLQGVQGLMLRFQSAMEQIPPSLPAREVIEKALDRADAVIAEGRDRVAQLRAIGDGAADLSAALQSTGEELSRDGRVGFQLTVEGDRRELAPVVGDEVLRIAGEAMTNAFRHAHATKIDVNVTYARSHLTVSVVDDGHGFEVGTGKEQPPGHWGLKGMQERAARIRSKLDISSASGAGTAVELTVPASIAFWDSPFIWRRFLGWWRAEHFNAEHVTERPTE